MRQDVRITIIVFRRLIISRKRSVPGVGYVLGMICREITGLSAPDL